MKGLRKSFFTVSILSVFIICFAGISHITRVQKLDGGPPYNTKAPGDKSCSGTEGNSACHSVGTDNSGPATINIDFGGGQASYIPGQTYLIKPSITHPDRVKFGFQIVTLKNSDNKFAGTITLVDTLLTRKQKPTWGSGQDRDYVMHRINGSDFSNKKGEWSYYWKAPTGNQGAVTFYASFVAGNNNGMNDAGDQTYYTKLVVTQAPAASVLTIKKKLSVSVYPNPIKETISLHFNLDKPAEIRIELINAEGKLIQLLNDREFSQGNFVENIELDPSVKPGIYYIRLISENSERVEKVVIE